MMVLVDCCTSENHKKLNAAFTCLILIQGTLRTSVPVDPKDLDATYCISRTRGRSLLMGRSKRWDQWTRRMNEVCILLI